VNMSSAPPCDGYCTGQGLDITRGGVLAATVAQFTQQGGGQDRACAGQTVKDGSAGMLLKQLLQLLLRHLDLNRHRAQ